MDYLADMLGNVAATATTNGMEAYITGVRDVDPRQDGRLLKISPKGLRQHPLLELQTYFAHIRIYRHRTPQLTDVFEGRPVGARWIRSFIEHNKDLAAQLIEQDKVQRAKLKAEEQSRARQKRVGGEELLVIRRTIECSCTGLFEGCAKCFGAGNYTVDGFGNIV